MRLKLAHGPEGFWLDFPEETSVTVGRALQSVQQKDPDLYKRWCDGDGRLRTSLNVFVNGEHIRYRKGMETLLRDGDEIYVIPILVGG